MAAKKACVFVLVAAGWCFAGSAPQIITAYKGSTPTIDAVLSPDEWMDADSIFGFVGWNDECHRTIDSADHSIRVQMKHDDTCLYFAFDVVDDLIYGFDNQRWSADTFPFFGDAVEIMFDGSNSQTSTTGTVGDSTCWQMLVNTCRSTLGGDSVGGLLEGYPRTPEILSIYTGWITSGAMEAVTRIKSDNEGKGYVVEWKIRLRSCVGIAPGTFWSPDKGLDTVGMNLEAEDIDHWEQETGCFLTMHQICNWITGYKFEKRNWGQLVLDPEPMPGVTSKRAGRQPVAEGTGSPLTLKAGPHQEISLSVQGAGPHAVELISLQGSTVRVFKGSGSACYSVDAHSMPAGVYVVSLGAQNRQNLARVTIVR